MLEVGRRASPLRRSRKLADLEAALIDEALDGGAMPPIQSQFAL